MEPNTLLINLPAILAFIGALLVPIIRKKLDKSAESVTLGRTKAETRKLSAETEALLAEKWREMAGDLERDLKDTKAELARTKEEQADLEVRFDRFRTDFDRLKHFSAQMWNGIQILLRQICDHGIDPDWEPNGELNDYWRNDGNDGFA